MLTLPADTRFVFVPIEAAAECSGLGPDVAAALAGSVDDEGRPLLRTVVVDGVELVELSEVAALVDAAGRQGIATVAVARDDRRRKEKTAPRAANARDGLYVSASRPSDRKPRTALLPGPVTSDGTHPVK